MWLPPSSLAHVIESPKRLQITVVQGDRLLFRVGQIERAQRFDVVDMPLAPVIPRHSRQEFRFEMAHKLGQRTPEQFLDNARRTSGRCSDMAMDSANKSRAESQSHCECRIATAALSNVDAEALAQSFVVPSSHSALYAATRAAQRRSDAFLLARPFAESR
jgi:hypothetical protein